MSTRDWLARSFRHAIERWLPSEATNPETEWSRDRLVSLLRERLSGIRVIVVANREPYIHNRVGPVGGELRWIRPASGLVTALDPIMRATGGVWVAHGSGSGDHEAADDAGRLAVPPNKPSYTLRRVWLTPEEEEGYYYGFSNRALWPLCHIAYTRPVFDASDWNGARVNAKVRRGRPRNRRRPRDRARAGLSLRAPSATRQAAPSDAIIAISGIPGRIGAFRICPWQERSSSDSSGRSARLPCSCVRQFSRHGRSPRRVARNKALPDPRAARNQSAGLIGIGGRHLASGVRRGGVRRSARLTG